MFSLLKERVSHNLYRGGGGYTGHTNQLSPSFPNSPSNTNSQFKVIATILAKIMWTANFSNANINIATFFREICRPLPPMQCCFSHLNFKSFIYQHWIRGRRGRNFLGINSVEIHLFLFDARGVHNNFCQDCSCPSATWYSLHWEKGWVIIMLKDFVDGNFEYKVQGT